MGSVRKLVEMYKVADIILDGQCLSEILKDTVGTKLDNLMNRTVMGVVIKSNAQGIQSIVAKTA